MALGKAAGPKWERQPDQLTSSLPDKQSLAFVALPSALRGPALAIWTRQSLWKALRHDPCLLLSAPPPARRQKVPVTCSLHLGLLRRTDQNEQRANPHCDLAGRAREIVSLVASETPKASTINLASSPSPSSLGSDWTMLADGLGQTGVGDQVVSRRIGGEADPGRKQVGAQPFLQRWTGR